jgi:hypothetical protein
MQTGIYEHYKGKRYEVIGIARHSETLEEQVVYKALYSSPDFGTNALWVRPRAMFEEEVEVRGKLVKRFRYTGSSDITID